MTYPYGQPGQDPQQQGGYPQSGGFQQPGGYAQPVYPQQAPPVYGYGQPQLGEVRPGGATAAAVLAFVQAGVTLFVTIFVLFGLASVPSAVDSGELTLAWLVAIAQAVGGGLLIYGGVQVLGGTGRTMYVVASGIELAICLYYLIRIASVEVSDTLPGAVEGKSAAIMFPILFAVMPVVGLSLAMTAAVSNWLRTTRPV